MKILIAHNHYGDFATGGEAMVFNAETNLLKSYGYEVLTYERSNSELYNKSLSNRVNAILHLHWSEHTIAEVGKIMDEFKPDVLHVHNYKFLITPSIFYAAKIRGIKTVLTLHNYRLIVPCGNFMTKEGKVCEKCLTENPINILKYRCAQGSILKSFLQYRLFTKTKFKLNQLVDLVDTYIVLSNFAKNKLEQTGVPGEQIVVKPNFITTYDKTKLLSKKERAVFIGRLSFEKGLMNLIEDWSAINYPLYIIGTGPLENKAKEISKSNKNIIFLGNMENKKVKEFLAESSFLVFPSTWYETFGLTIAEAMSVGVPVIATNLGPRNEMIQNGINGFLYENGNSTEFIDKVNILTENKELRNKMGTAAKEEYNRKYTPEINIQLLSAIYKKLLA
jgi:glycosyltransferase involved in cell wall biosynthesis